MKKYIQLNNLITANGIHPEYDEEALRAYFQDEINAKTQFFHSLEEKIDYMIDNGYWDKSVLIKYSYEEIKTIFQRAYGFKFRFKSFMGASKFYEEYAIKHRDGSGWLERYEDRMSIVALTLADGDYDLAHAMVEHLVLQLSLIHI